MAAGLLALPRGVAHVVRHPRLWPWILLPLALNAVLLVLLAWGALRVADAWSPDLATPWWWGVDWLRPVAAWTAGALLSLLAVAAAFLLTVHLAGVVNAPFYDVLAERTERAVLGLADAPREGWWEAARRSFAAAVTLLLVEALVMAPLFLLSFTAVGAPVFLLAGAFFSGLSLVDATLSRRGHAAGRRLAWGRRHAPLVLGLGLPASLFPPLAPFGIVGGALAYLEDGDKA